MAIRNILTDDDPILRKQSRDVVVFDERLHQLLDDMAETMALANGAGLAAPQVGILRRVAIVDVGDEDGLVEIINPEIIKSSREIQSGLEGCLSFPGWYGTVERPMKVKVRAQDRHGNLIEVKGEELKARALCHEIDHLNGILFQKYAQDLHELLPDEEENLDNAQD
jgi:peptide deformylase